MVCVRSHVGSSKLPRVPSSQIWVICLGFWGVQRLRTSRFPAGLGQESLAEKANFPVQTEGEKYLKVRKCQTHKYTQK